MTDDELNELDSRCRTHAAAFSLMDAMVGVRLVAEVRRLRAQQTKLKAFASDVRAFWASHPGDHVVSGGISKQGEALLVAIEGLK